MKKVIMDTVKVIVSVLIVDILLIAGGTFARLPKLDINMIQTFFETLVNTVASAWMRLEFAVTATLNGSIPVKIVLALLALTVVMYKLIDIITTEKKTEKTVKEYKVDPAE